MVKFIKRHKILRSYKVAEGAAVHGPCSPVVEQHSAFRVSGEHRKPVKRAFKHAVLDRN